MKKLPLIFLIGLSVTSNSFAEKSDWNGKFIIDNNTQSISVEHTPTNVIFQSMITAKTCVSFGKGACFNGIKFKEDLNFCTATNADDFTKEVAKLGPILSRDVKLGPNYTVN